MLSAPPATMRLHDAVCVARARNASDVHLDVGTAPVLRIDGVLEALPESALTSGELDEILRALMSEREHACLEREGDVTVAWRDAELGAMRVHVFAGTRGPAVAVRLLGRRIPSLESLGLPEIVGTLAQRERGLLILGGPTGSGKSTTMASLVDRINATRPRRIVTIEDPIEYRHDHRRSVVTQREIGRDTPSLTAALHGVLRADPDVIVVGEMRDAEAMRAALTAAETGHLVFATLHTGDAAETVNRIVDAFTGSLQQQIRTQLAHVLVAVVCQRLLRRAGGTGRCAAAEILIATDAVKNLIRDAKSHQLGNAMATGRQAGMQTLAQHVEALLCDRQIDLDEARRLGIRIPATLAAVPG